MIPTNLLKDLVEDSLPVLRPYRFLLRFNCFVVLNSQIAFVYILYPDVGSDETVWLAAFFLTTSLAVCTAIYFPPLNILWTMTNR